MKAKTTATLDALADAERDSDHFLVDGRLRFIDALRQTGQMRLVSELTDFNREMEHIEACMWHCGKCFKCKLSA